jgi:hypothetical protein
MDAILVGDLLVVGRYSSLDFIRVRDGSTPRHLGAASYAEGVVRDDFWAELAVRPRLARIDSRHFFVTDHVMSQVWEVP